MLQLLSWLLLRGNYHPTTLVGSTILLLLFTTALCAPWLAPFDPVTIDPQQARLLSSWQHLLGTDYAGRDIFSRLLHSIRLAYWGGFLAILIMISFGTAVGVGAGYAGGWVDNIAMRVLDLWLALPGLLFLLVMVAILGTGLYQVLFAVGLAGIPAYTRLVRGMTLHQKQQPHIEATRAIGATNRRVMLHHIVPNMIPPLVTYLATSFGNAILAAGTLGFIGLGGDPSIPELGQLLQDGRDTMNQKWWPILGPIVVLWLTMLGVNLISDGVAELK
jgi:ABC-type dipeptide/oligopeptide/nickel transport system permease subunit